MEKQQIEPFLLRVAIPKVTGKDRLPEGVESSLLWDAVYRAYRDVATGRQYVAAFTSAKDGRGLNVYAVKLYGLLDEWPRESPVDPRKLIDDLYGDDALWRETPSPARPSYGAIQKLVNMTMKYLFILSTYGQYNGLVIDESKLDCPLDSNVLGAIPKEKVSASVRWTSLDDPKLYESIQKAIGECVSGGCRLQFDFENWQSL